MKFVKGPTLEEEMRAEPDEEKKRGDRNFYAIEGREGEEACARVIGDGSNEGGKKVALYGISPRGLPIEMVTNDSPTGDPEEQKSVTEEVDSSDLRRLIKWKDKSRKTFFPRGHHGGNVACWPALRPGRTSRGTAAAVGFSGRRSLTERPPSRQPVPVLCTGLAAHSAAQWPAHGGAG